MWQLETVVQGTDRLSFSDGKPVSEPRGGSITSVRLTVENQGFIDFTDLQLLGSALGGGDDPRETEAGYLDLNGERVLYNQSPAKVKLVLDGKRKFSFSLLDSDKPVLTGTIKPFPDLSDTIVQKFAERIKQGYVPYPQPAGVGKTTEEIRALGKQYFPFSPHSFELAMAIYDWTTASFARMVLLSVFEYTSLESDNQVGPLDKNSLSAAIFKSNWPPYTPKSSDYMKSFLMTPADTQADVYHQLETVGKELQDFAIIGNQMLQAATLSMPRTPVLRTPRLYSGQIDMSQINMSQFGAEFLQFPGNAGPPGAPLEGNFQQAMDTFISPGSTVTTKQVWSFSDSMDIAMHYQNGIILVAYPPRNDSFVWDTPCYITDLSNESTKVEWVFPAGTSFRIMSTEQSTVSGKQVYTIQLEQLLPKLYALAGDQILESEVPGTVASETSTDTFGVLKAALPTLAPGFPDTTPMRRVEECEVSHTAHSCNGRFCCCVEKLATSS